MQKTIALFVNDFAPGKEGVSNEANLLLKYLASDPNLRVLLHNISTNCRFALSSSHITYGLPFLPLGMLLTKLIEKRSDLIHIYGSLTGRLYLYMLKKHPILLTNTSAMQASRVRQCAKHWDKIDKLIVECRRDEYRVLQYGIERDRVSLIYPGVDPGAFFFQPPPTDFTIGFASSPISIDNQAITKRGVNLLLSAALRLSDIQFLLLWRNKHFRALQNLLSKSSHSNVSVTNEILSDMNAFYARVHCIIVPATSPDDCKPCPNSIMESLAAGKPVLVSGNVGISDLISQEGCGLVFEPEVEDMIAKINDMKRDYSKYQNRARHTAEHYFSAARFVQQYRRIYNELIVS